VSSRPAAERCGRCAHFVDEPRALERSLVGLAILSSAWGDSRGDQGLCELHDLFLQPVMTCSRFVSRKPLEDGCAGLLEGPEKKSDDGLEDLGVDSVFVTNPVRPAG
jgi:hypothetical protein